MPQFTSPRPSNGSSLRKPRNPWVAPSQLRKAGVHRAAHARQAARIELAQTLRELWSPPRHD
ncbi:hypothetical protein [Inhella sp.]|uniref:hypothetical protein n=1 Tax=Inhella sp. TaxID=1921806 RepID=UPI0035AE6DC7